MLLEDRLNDDGLGGIWVAELGYIIRLLYAKIIKTRSYNEKPT